MSDEETPTAPEEAEGTEMSEAPAEQAAMDAPAAETADAAADMAAEPGGDAEDLALRELESRQAEDQAEGTDQGGEEGEDGEEFSRTAGDLEAVFDIPVRVSAILGKSHLQVSDLLKRTQGAVIELDRKVGEAIDIFVNNRLVARGEVVLVEDRLGVTMTEIIKTE